MAPQAAAALAAQIVTLLRPARVHVVDAAEVCDALAARGVVPVVEGADLGISGDPSIVPDAARVLVRAPQTDIAGWLADLSGRGWTADASADFGELVLLDSDAARASAALVDGGAGLIATRIGLYRRECRLGEAERRLEQRHARHDQAQRHAMRVNAGLEDKLAITEARLTMALHEREVITGSTMWRALAPVRAALNRVRRSGPTVAGAVQDGGVGASAYEQWIARHDTLDDADRAAIRVHVAQLAHPPTISVLMPVFDTAEALLRAAIGSVRAQLYPHWELCIADDASRAPQVARVLMELEAADPRIRCTRLARNGNISAASNAALALATGEFVALMDHDDLLPEHALYEVAVALDARPDLDLLYSDEDQIDAMGRRKVPYLKPDWNIELMLAHNLVSHLGVFRRSLVERLGGLRVGYEGSQDYDLALRVADASSPARIHHIPSVLYHWRQHTTSFSKARIEACIGSARRAIADHLERTGQARDTTVQPSPWIENWTRVRYHLPDPAPRVSVIVPTRDKPELLERCAEGVLARTDYPDLELIIVDNDSAQPATAALLARLAADARVRVLAYPGAFNYSAMNNRAAAIATGDVLALVNNDIEVVGSGWLAEMVSQALRPEIGAVGARLLFANGSVQHVGVVLGVGSFDGGPGVAGHYSLADMGASFGYFGASVLVHEVAAVTGACMVMRRSAWEDAGGLDEALPVAFNDVDLCLRLRAAGLRNLFTPHAELVHHESASRGDDLAPEHRERFARECRLMRDRWGAVLDRDPFYNPNFSRLDGMFRLIGASLRRRPWW